MNSQVTVKPAPVAPLSPQDKRERDRKVRIGRSIVAREVARIIRDRVSEEAAIEIAELQHELFIRQADLRRHAKTIIDEIL